MSCILTPWDIAGFLYSADFPCSDEQAVIHDIWMNDKALISEKYHDKKRLFRRDIRRMIDTYEMLPHEWDAFEVIMNDLDTEIELPEEAEEDTVIDLFLKLTWLALRFMAGKSYKRIKLKRFLGLDHYRRRTGKFVAHVRSVLMDLDMVTYKKGGVQCDIADFKLEEMMTFRLQKYR